MSTDPTPSPFDQRDATVRCEWGIAGIDALAPAEVFIIVDVLSFTTCVDVAVSRGAAVLPYQWKDERAATFAASHGAILAGTRRSGADYSLSPASFLDAPRGLRCVLPSPNGATLTVRAASIGAVVIAGCLRNASVVAAAAARFGATINVCPAGERWPNGTLRPSIEDWIGAGAILSRLPGTRSPEADAAVAAFTLARPSLLEVLAASGSGRELIERGFAVDVELAAQYDVSDVVPRLDAGAYVAAP